MPDIIGKRTRLLRVATKPLAPREWLPGFWKRRSEPPRVVFIISLPRTGSSLAKRFLGDHPKFILSRMSPSHNWWDAWCLQRLCYPFGKTVLDKRTRYIEYLPEITASFGSHVRILLLIRDPRDELVSLHNIDRHHEIPRGTDFFTYWHEAYSNAISHLRETYREDEAWLLRYEDLVHRPRETKSSFLGWLGFPKQNIRDEYQNTVEAIATGEERSEDPSCHRRNRVQTDPVGRWKQLEPQSSLRGAMEIPHETGKIAGFMESLGYGKEDLNLGLSLDNHLVSDLDR